MWHCRIWLSIVIFHFSHWVGLASLSFHPKSISNNQESLSKHFQILQLLLILICLLKVLNYTSLIIKIIHNWISFVCLCFVAPCGGTISGDSGVIESIGYPTLSYPNNVFCHWHLRGLPGHYLTISFEDFNLQSSPGCTKDFVEIWENHTSG